VIARAMRLVDGRAAWAVLLATGLFAGGRAIERWEVATYQATMILSFLIAGTALALFKSDDGKWTGLFSR
jgi:hypothetical protein